MLKDLPLSSYISIAGAGVSLLAMLVSVWHAVVSKKSLKIQSEQFEEAKPKLELKVARSFYECINGKNHYVFNITVYNKASSNNTLSKCVLKVHTNKGYKYEFDLQQDRCCTPRHLTIPKYIQGYEVVTGLISFCVPVNLQNQVDEFEITIMDTKQNYCSERIISVLEAVQNV